MLRLTGELDMAGVDRFERLLTADRVSRGRDVRRRPARADLHRLVGPAGADHGRPARARRRGTLHRGQGPGPGQSGAGDDGSRAADRTRRRASRRLGDRQPEFGPADRCPPRARPWSTLRRDRPPSDPRVAPSGRGPIRPAPWRSARGSRRRTPHPDRSPRREARGPRPRLEAESGHPAEAGRDGRCS